MKTKLQTQIIKTAKDALTASRTLATLTAEVKNAVLKDMAGVLLISQVDILKANRKDACGFTRQTALFIDRLSLNPEQD